MCKCINLEAFWTQKPRVFEPGPPKMRNCLNFGALVGEKPRVFELGLSKMRNCLNLGPLEREKHRVFEPGPPKVREGLKKTIKTIHKTPNPREGLKKIVKTISGDSWAGPGVSSKHGFFETLTHFGRSRLKNPMFFAFVKQNWPKVREGLKKNMFSKQKSGFQTCFF